MGSIFIVSWTETSPTKKFNNTEMTREQRMNYAKHLEKPTDLKNIIIKNNTNYRTLC